MMFKEELHTSFDRISPAPELLDRISAMMSEEAAKPKKPIYLNAVKYGGIAAAVVLAAGATVAVVQNAGSGSITTESAAANTTAAVAAAETAYENDGMARLMPESFAADAVNETEATVGAEPEMQEKADETAAENENMTAGEYAPVTTTTAAEPANYVAAAEEAVQNNSADMFSMKSVPENEVNAETAEEEPSVMMAAAPEEPEMPGEMQAEEADELYSDDAYFADEDADYSTAYPEAIEEEAEAEACYEKLTFNEIITSSYSVVWAKCTGTVRENNGDTGYRFTLLENIAGGETEKNFLVFPYDNSVVIANGGEYIIPLYKTTSVFWDNPAHYLLTSGTIMTTDRSGNITDFRTWADKPEETIGSVKDMQDYIKKYGLVCSESEEDIGPAFTGSDSIEDVVSISDHVMDVEITEILIDFVEDRTTYKCRVNCVYKGADDVADEITITMPKGIAEVGQQYTVAVSRLSETGTSYVVTSLDKSVFPTGSAEAKKISALAG
ncbi:MAG TPA: hypothetical protein DDX72_03305 [Ruminococcaceae bacterium]|nr:hypothetical protein [Oscillospiraceae bacterium]